MLRQSFVPGQVGAWAALDFARRVFECASEGMCVPSRPVVLGSIGQGPLHMSSKRAVPHGGLLCVGGWSL